MYVDNTYNLWIFKVMTAASQCMFLIVLGIIWILIQILFIDSSFDPVVKKR